MTHRPHDPLLPPGELNLDVSRAADPPLVITREIELHLLDLLDLLGIDLTSTI